MFKRLFWLALIALPIGAAAAQIPETTEAPAALVLDVWLPDALMPPGSAALNQLNSQIAAFEDAHPGIQVRLRVRLTGETGAALPGDLLYALRTAAAVAPGALPDLVLLRRADLVTAYSYRVLATLDDFNLNADSQTGMPTAVAALALVDGAIAGIPYLIQVEHMLYTGEPPSEASFAAFLAYGERFAFPAGRAGALPRLFLAQYIDAVGPIDADGSTVSDGVIDGDGLRAVYAFYEQARAADLLDPNVMTFSSSADYLPLLLSGELRAAAVSSTVYLRAAAEGERMPGYGPFPTLSGAPITILDGWLWALSTRDSERTAAARLLLEWLFDPQRQFLLAQSVPALPAQPAALRLWPDAAYAAFVSGLLERAALPPDTFGAASRALQAGLLSVLNGERTAAQAVREVIAQTTNP
ncbi:MAG: extracellular solute-binding protein [Candidatus Flexifilum sp.]